MPEQNIRSKWDILINWAILSLAGFFIGLSARRLVLGLIFGVLGGQTLGKIAEGAFIGLAIGLAQMMALPPQIPRNPWWVIAATIGWGLGWGFGWGLALQLSGGFSFVFAIVGALAGLLTGVFQWPLLQARLRHSWLWIIGNGLGWAGGLAAGMGFGGSLGWPLGGGIAGIITGATLIFLIRKMLASSLQGQSNPDVVEEPS